MLPMFREVEIVTDKFLDEGVRRGTLGFIIEVYDGGRAYEVEICGANGITLALIVVSEEDVVLVPDTPCRDERWRLS